MLFCKLHASKHPAISAILPRSMSSQPAIAVVIVAYGHAAHVPATLAALEGQIGVTLETVVVENGDGGSAAVARGFEHVTVLEPGRNLGFAGGCNLAIAQTDAPLIVLLNPDVVPQLLFVQALCAPLDGMRAGVVGAKLCYPDGRLQHAGGYLQQPAMLAQHYGYGEADRGQYDAVREVEFVTGAALAVRRETWQTLGGLDEAFFPAYYEDTDLCWRVRAHGLQVRYEPRALAVHHEAAALGKGSLAYHRLYHRNRLRFIFKHYDNAWLLHHWLPGELQHLRTTADDAEIVALGDAYRWWQGQFLGIAQDEPAPSVELYSPDSELGWTMQQLANKRVVEPQPFRSRWPLVGRARGWTNRLATEAYLRPILQQQNDYNHALQDAIEALARQRRTTDAALICQGMLLAKMLNRNGQDLQDLQKE